MRAPGRLLAATLSLCSIALSSYASPPDRTVNYAGGPLGEVVFSGKAHAYAKLSCEDCHDAIFQKSARAFHMTSRDHIKGLGCAVCHNGKQAFGTRDVHSCERCHKKD